MNIIQTIMPPVVLANGTTDVDINWETDYQDTEALTVQAPAFAETLSWQGSVDGIAFAAILDQSAGTAIKFPTSGAMIIYNGVFSGLKKLRIHSTGAAAADRTFLIGKAWRGI